MAPITASMLTIQPATPMCSRAKIPKNRTMTNETPQTIPTTATAGFPCLSSSTPTPSLVVCACQPNARASAAAGESLGIRAAER